MNAIQSLPTQKSIDFSSINELSHEQKPIQSYVNNGINNELNHNDIKSIVKSAYEIPSPTIVLPGDFSSSPKSITNSNIILNKTHRSTPIDNNRNL